MGLKFSYKLESFDLEVGEPSYVQNKNIGSGEILIESPHKTLLTFFSHKLFLIRGHNQNNNPTNKNKNKGES